MLPKVSSKVAPLLLLILATIWAAAAVLPLLYSLTFPNPTILGVVRTLEGRAETEPEWSNVVHDTLSTYGQLKHAVPVSAHYEASAEYKFGQSHTSKQTQYAYIASFERYSRPVVIVVNLTVIDGTSRKLVVGETSPSALVENYSLPLVALAGALFWFRNTRRGWRTRSESPKNE